MKTRKVVVLPYDEAWKSAFEDIKAEIESALGELIIGIEHVGSTSVEGMSAKPCIDLDVIIEDYSVFDAVVAKLATIGYIHEGDLGIKDREELQCLFCYLLKFLSKTFCFYPKCFSSKYPSLLSHNQARKL